MFILILYQKIQTGCSFKKISGLQNSPQATAAPLCTVNKVSG